MSSVRERSPGRWQVRAFVGRDPLTGKPEYQTTTIGASGKREAQRKGDRWEDELRQGQLSGDGGTFGELCDAWLEIKKRRWPPSTYLEQKRIVNTYLRRPLGDVDVSKIRTHTLDRLYLHLAERGGRCQRRPCPRPANCAVPGHPKRCQRVACVRSWACSTHVGACKDWVPCDDSPCEHSGPLSAATVNRIHTVVSSALEQAVTWGWISRNPAERAEPGEVITEEVIPPADEDVILLLAEAEDLDDRLAVYLVVTIETGARRGAMHALRWTYWSGMFPDGTSTIRFPTVISVGEDGPVERPATRTKRSGALVTLGPYATAALAAHHERMSARALQAGASLPEDAFIFSNDPFGSRPWYPDSTSRKVRWLRQDIGLDNEARLKDLRHLMATQLLRTPGVTPKVVAERGGWRRLQTMLEVYAHTLPADDAQAAGVVDRILHCNAS